MTSARLKFALLLVVAALALVPLYGDPRSTPVTHAEWARMLLRALQMDDVMEVSAKASQAFSTLSWKNSLALPADHYLRAAGVEAAGEPGRVVATQASGEVVFPLAVVRGGDYKLRVRIAGNPATPAEAEVTPLGATTAVKRFTIVPASVSGWVDAGSLHLDPGAYTTSILLPPGTSLEKVEVAPPCVPSIEPPQGWRATAILQTAELAVTIVKALDLEKELPPAGSPIDVYGSSFQTTGGAAVVAASAGTGPDQVWLKAGASGLQAIVSADVPEAGLYSVSTFGSEGGGQSWLADSCRKAVVCGTAVEAATAAGPEWRTIMTAEFTAGRHLFAVILGSGAGVERLRLERKKDDPADYAATLKRLGFDPGPEGPAARNKAVDAMKFIQGKRTEVIAKPCGDPLTTTVASQGAQTGTPQQAQLQPTAPVVGPPPPPPNSGTGPPPGAPAAIPPQEPASPTTPGP